MPVGQELFYEAEPNLLAIVDLFNEGDVASVWRHAYALNLSTEWGRDKSSSDVACVWLRLRYEPRASRCR
jgi:hypothetical protein